MNQPESNHGRALLNRFLLLLLAAALVLSGGALVWRGLDFALAVLVGSGFIMVNFLWTKRVVENFLLHRTPKGWLGFTYFLKLTLTGFLLYLAIVPLAMDPIGILVGLSTLFVAGLLAAAQGSQRKGAPR